MTSDMATKQPTSWVDTPPRSPSVRHLNGELIAQMPWLDKVSGSLQKWLGKLYGQPGQPSYKVKDFLSGVWLGHTLHPVLVSIPLGAWSATMMFDLASLASEDEAMERGADATMWLGLAGAAG